MKRKTMLEDERQNPTSDEVANLLGHAVSALKILTSGKMVCDSELRYCRLVTDEVEVLKEALEPEELPAPEPVKKNKVVDNVTMSKRWEEAR